MWLEIKVGLDTAVVIELLLLRAAGRNRFFKRRAYCLLISCLRNEVTDVSG